MEPEWDIGTFRPDRPGVRKVLGDLEAEIMELIWARPTGRGTTVREIFEVLYERRHLAYTTVMNTMTRLARKHMLRAEKADQAYVYFPNFTQDECCGRQQCHADRQRQIEQLIPGRRAEPAHRSTERRQHPHAQSQTGQGRSKHREGQLREAVRPRSAQRRITEQRDK